MSSTEIQSDTTKIIKYTEDFLRKFKDVKYEAPESIKKSELYIHAPKPTVNRPKVDRSRSKDGKTKSFLTAGERQELQRRRKEDEKKKFGEFREGFSTPVKTPVKARKAAAPSQGGLGASISNEVWLEKIFVPPRQIFANANVQMDCPPPLD